MSSFVETKPVVFAHPDRAGIGSEGRACEVAAEIAEALCALPAVATLDWCDRAADCLTAIRQPCIVAMMVATVSTEGEVSEVEAVGLASRVATGAGPGGSMHELRGRAERLRSIGWTPGDVSQWHLRTGAVSKLPGAAAGSGPMAELWRDFHVSDVLGAVAPLGAAPLGRSMVVYVAMTEAGIQASPLEAAVLRGTVPVLARRAIISIGGQRSRHANWISPREQVVLDALVLGKSVRQIAEDLGRSPHTVHDHVKSLHRKLNASSRGELIARALGHLSECTRIRETSRRVKAVRPQDEVG